MSFVEEEVLVDGVPAIRRRKLQPPRKQRPAYLLIPMGCVEALSTAKLPSAGWSLALWIIWQHKVSSGEAAMISSKFATRAGIQFRAGRRHALASLEATGLFQVTRNGKQTVRVSLGTKFKEILARE